MLSITKSETASRRGSMASQISSVGGSSKPRCSQNASPLIDPVSPGSSRRSSFDSQHHLGPNQIPPTMSQHFERLHRRRDAIGGAGTTGFPSLNNSASSVATLTNQGNNLILASQSMGLMNDFSTEYGLNSSFMPRNSQCGDQSQDQRRGSDPLSNRATNHSQNSLARYQGTGINRNNAGSASTMQSQLDGMEDLLIPDDMANYLSQGAHLEQNQPNGNAAQYATGVNRPSTCPPTQQQTQIPPPPPYNQVVQNGNSCYANPYQHPRQNPNFRPPIAGGSCYSGNMGSPAYSQPAGSPYSNPSTPYGVTSPESMYNQQTAPYRQVVGHSNTNQIGMGHSPCMSPPVVPTGNNIRRASNDVTPSPTISNHGVNPQHNPISYSNGYSSQQCYSQPHESQRGMPIPHQHHQLSQMQYYNNPHNFQPLQASYCGPQPIQHNCTHAYQAPCPNQTQNPGFAQNGSHPAAQYGYSPQNQQACNYGTPHPNCNHQAQAAFQQQQGNSNWQQQHCPVGPMVSRNQCQWEPGQYTQPPPMGTLAYSQVGNTSYHGSLNNQQLDRRNPNVRYSVEVQCRNVTSQSQKSTLQGIGKGNDTHNGSGVVPRGMRPDTYQRTLKYLQDCEAEKKARNNQDPEGNPLSPDSTTIEHSQQPLTPKQKNGRQEQSVHELQRNNQCPPTPNYYNSQLQYQHPQQHDQYPRI